MSFGRQRTLVREVATRLVDFLGYWVQTRTGYDTLCLKTMDSEWLRMHQLVISQRGHNPSRFIQYTGPPLPTMPPSLPTPDDHVLYTIFALDQPRGLLVKCNNPDCGLGVKSQHRSDKVIITCKACGWQCEIPAYQTDRESSLGRKGIVTVRYPQSAYSLPGGRVVQPPPPPRRTKRAKQPRNQRSRGGKSSNPGSSKDSLHLPKLTLQATSLPTTPLLTTPSSSVASSPRFAPVHIPSSMGPAALFLRSRSEGSRSATATPPPPSPQEPPTARKRSSNQTLSQDATKRSRSDAARDQ